MSKWSQGGFFIVPIIAGRIVLRAGYRYSCFIPVPMQACMHETSVYMNVEPTQVKQLDYRGAARW